MPALVSSRVKRNLCVHPCLAPNHYLNVEHVTLPSALQPWTQGELPCRQRMAQHRADHSADKGGILANAMHTLPHMYPQ